MLILVLLQLLSFRLQAGIQMLAILMHKKVFGEKQKDVDFWILMIAIMINFVQVVHLTVHMMANKLEGVILIFLPEAAKSKDISQIQFVIMNFMNSVTQMLI